MEKTTNYDQFKFLEYNRDVNENHVKFMMKIIGIKNRLSDFPLLVNEKMEVFDGQHRLEAAKRMQLPVYYEIKRNMEKEDVYDINNCQRAWKAEDQLKYWSEVGNKEYIRIREFFRKNDLEFSEGIVFIKSCWSGKFTRDFKAGLIEFTPTDYEYAEKNLLKWNEFVSYVKPKIVGTKRFLDASTLKLAFVRCLKIREFNFDIFMRKLPYGLHILRPTGLTSEYQKQLLNIYNWRNQNPIGMQKDILPEAENY